MRKKRVTSKKISAQKTKIKKSSYIIIFIVIILIYLFFQGDQGFLKYLQLQKEKEQLKKKIEEIKKQNKEFSDEIELLTNNYRYIEKIAREQHQMGKKGEKLYIIAPQKK